MAARSLLAEDGPIGPLAELADAGVAVDRHDQAVPFPRGLLQIGDVAHVQQVEAAVREDDPLAQSAAGGDVPFQHVERADFVARRSFAAEEVGQRSAAA